MNRQRIVERDGGADHYVGWLSAERADALFIRLTADVAWQRRDIRFMGKSHPMPRLIGYCGEAPYRYSGQTHEPAPLHADLVGLRASLNEMLGAEFNSILLNRYRDGQDGMSWHADNERQLGPSPLIASLSLGASRRLAMRHCASGARYEITLAHGDLLVMLPPMQGHWQHAVPKTRKPVASRINVTFRQVIVRP